VVVQVVALAPQHLRVVQVAAVATIVPVAVLHQLVKVETVAMEVKPHQDILAAVAAALVQLVATQVLRLVALVAMALQHQSQAYQ
jgi:hypothetical protein